MTRKFEIKQEISSLLARAIGIPPELEQAVIEDTVKALDLEPLWHRYLADRFRVKSVAELDKYQRRTAFTHLRTMAELLNDQPHVVPFSKMRQGGR